jgi:hypothetical protein
MGTSDLFPSKESGATDYYHPKKSIASAGSETSNLESNSQHGNH